MCIAVAHLVAVHDSGRTNLQDHHLEEARKFADGLASRLLVSAGEPR